MSRLGDAAAPRTAEPPVCEHGEWTSLYGGLLKRCGRCTLVATAVPPAFAYDQDYFTNHDKGGYDFESVFARALDAARFLPELARLEALGVERSILDVGCATGTFLELARARGWRVAGVEIAESARQRAERRAGVPIARSLDDLPAGATFDVVTLHHVLEHVHEPFRFLRDAVQPRVGQLLLIEVPNFASLASRVRGPIWQDLRPEQHVYHYEARTLTQLVECAGFDAHVFTLWQPLWGLRLAAETLSLLPRFARRPRHESPRPGDGDGNMSAASEKYTPPRGVRWVLTEASRLALWPLVRALEAANLGERLVLEARPRSGLSRATL